MKKVWNAPDVKELTIQATSCEDWGWNSGRPTRPSRPSRPGRPGNGGPGSCKPGWGDNMSPDEFHPEDGTSSF